MISGEFRNRLKYINRLYCRLLEYHFGMSVNFLKHQYCNGEDAIDSDVILTAGMNGTNHRLWRYKLHSDWQ